MRIPKIGENWGRSPDLPLLVAKPEQVGSTSSLEIGGNR
jgi:hypothetical protein